MNITELLQNKIRTFLVKGIFYLFQERYFKLDFQVKNNGLKQTYETKL